MDLQEFFKLHPRVALAFSGGCDSAYLLYSAVQCGAYVDAYYAKLAFQPNSEYINAVAFANDLGVQLTAVDVDVMSNDIIANGVERCYLCKTKIFQAIAARAKERNCDCIIDGTNASDNVSDRPGFRALRELGVLSPLRECGLTKAQIRTLSQSAGLPTSHKPSNSCLATRIATNEIITIEKLSRIEQAESILSEMGYIGHRVRLHEGVAILEIAAEQSHKFINQFELIRKCLAELFEKVDYNPKWRQNG